MNARQKGKIDLFFGGLASKFESSREFFVGLTWKTVSGRKEYNGSTALRDGKLVYSFAGTKEYDDMRTLLSTSVPLSCNMTVPLSNTANAVTAAEY